MMTRVPPVSGTVNVVPSNVRHVLQARQVLVAQAPGVRVQAQGAAVLLQARRLVETVRAVHAPLTQVQDRFARAQGPVLVQDIAAITAAVHVLPHVPAQVLAQAHPVPIVLAVPLFFPSNLSDNRLARPACKIRHHEYLNRSRATQNVRHYFPP
jgi:hypothetical protein